MFNSEKIGYKIGGVTKSYGTKTVLENVGFEMPFGKIIGLFGLNGSGKTTLFNILSGLDGNFEGYINKNDFRDISYMTANNIFPKDFTIKNLLEIESIFMEKQNTKKIKELLKEINVNENTYFIKLSTGIRQYVKFIITLYSGANICLFDELFANIDITLKDKISNLLISEINEDRLFILATHEIKEVERLIDGFYILNNHNLSDFYSSNDVIEKYGTSIEEFYRGKVNEKQKKFILI